MLKIAVCAIACLTPGTVLAQTKSFTLNAPTELVETGVLKHILPRFSLKTGIRITLGDGTGDATFGPNGVPVFRHDKVIWHLDKTDSPHADAFLDWLVSDVGKRTINGFAPDGTAQFDTDVGVAVAVVETVIQGDALLGEHSSLTKCGRCHVVSDANRMNAIGSTPSFALLRGFPDWEDRFSAFFVLKPHAAFTQVTDVTDPFPDHLPSPISPIVVTLEEIEAIMAYVAQMTPADLGAPIQSQ